MSITSDSAWILGVLQSRVHCLWALSVGGDLGGNTPTYYKSVCFERFPFPTFPTDQQSIATTALLIDDLVKRQLALHPSLTLTDIYNVLESVRAGIPLLPKEKVTHEHGLVEVLRSYHDELDRLVFATYGWDDLGDVLLGKPGATTRSDAKSSAQEEAEQNLLARLVELNERRHNDELNGTIHWLRPDFQKDDAKNNQRRLGIETSTVIDAYPVTTVEKRAWPTDLASQVKAISDVLKSGSKQLTVDEVAARFTRARKERIAQILETLKMLGR